MNTVLRTKNIIILDAVTPSLSDIFYTDTVDVDSTVSFNVQIDYTSLTADMLVDGTVENSNDGVTWSESADFSLSGTSDTCSIYHNNVGYAFLRIKFQLLRGSPTITAQIRTKGY
jgi:hypothetical protein